MLYSLEQYLNKSKELGGLYTNEIFGLGNGAL